MLKKVLFSLAVATFAAGLANAKTTYNFKPEMGKVSFKTKGWPSLITIKGESDGFKGQLNEVDQKINGTLSFQLDKLKTGITLRDNHMKDNYLQVKEFPTAELKVADLDATKSKGDFKGELKLHGVTKAVKGTYKLKGGKQVKALEAELIVKLSDFKIAIPSYQGITVAENVTITVSSKVNPEQTTKLAGSR